MMVLRGAPALSAFRLDRVTRAVREIAPEVASVHADHLHLVEVARPLTDAERAALEALLSEGPGTEAPPRPGVALWVTPRPGTVSPWSSKATDIARNCGLDAVVRLERAVVWTLGTPQLDPAVRERIAPLLHDRMTEAVLTDLDGAAALFRAGRPAPLGRIALGADPEGSLRAADRALGLALSADEIRYLADAYGALGRDPTDAELMMFAQANSEHCRHKIFNASWTVDGAPQERSLFQMIKHTRERTLDRNPEGAPGRVLSAYQDNAAVFHGWPGERFLPDPETGEYRYGAERPLHVLIKVETHNHPTAISPHPGAGTGSGGEIRDEGATGRGGKPKAGLVGYHTSHLRLPGAAEPWEADDPGRPDRIASPLQIMLEAPLGAAAYNNEFGRPGLTGYFRTFEARLEGPAGPEVRGYHKPILIAGGYGNVAPEHVEKQPIPAGAALVVLGGPAMRIGLGGGAASSVAQGASHAELDFASVQRANPEIQRRCQEVLDRCQAMGEANPILSVHDVGAGGLSNALPELVHGADRGGRFDLRAIPSAEPDMSPLEIWSNEAQERYVLAIRPEDLDRFRALCDRERCPFAVVGEALDADRLEVTDPLLGEPPVDLPLSMVLGAPPRMERAATRARPALRPFDRTGVTLEEAARRVLRFPAVADKRFLITIGDRSITGQVARDPMVGPWQVAVADVAVTTATYRSNRGEAMAMGERTPVALLSGPASARLAVGEALTNLAAAADDPRTVSLSANWMAAAGHPGEDAVLFDTVRALGMELCPELEVVVPVGKDSMSMRTVWSEGGVEKRVVAPVSLVVTAFAPVEDTTATLTPLLRLDQGPTELWLLDLGAGRNRLGGSALAQVFGQLGDEPPDLDEPAALRGLLATVRALRGRLLAWHDRSDGGLWATLCEMAFASRCGLRIALPDGDPLGWLFAEELGAVVQIRVEDRERLRATLAAQGLADRSWRIGEPTPGGEITVVQGEAPLLSLPRAALHREWSSVSARIAALRDDPTCAAEEADRVLDEADPGLVPLLTFDVGIDPARGRIGRPKVAILREQGVNGQIEMAAAFERAGFLPVDVHMTDLATGRVALKDFHGLVACGGFSYGDVLGAGGGWAASILYQPRLREAFGAFFARPDAFTLGVCNGCQMLARLRELIPGAEAWPRFLRNRSEQFEGRLSLVRIEPSPSILFAGMAGARLLVPVAHGEGRATFDDEAAHDRLALAGLVAARFVDGRGEIATRYPVDPNGSPGGLTAVTTPDGRITAMMPHPERAFRWSTLSWCPDDWRHPSGDSPWMRLFRNARAWVD